MVDCRFTLASQPMTHGALEQPHVEDDVQMILCFQAGVFSIAACVGEVGFLSLGLQPIVFCHQLHGSMSATILFCVMVQKL